MIEDIRSFYLQHGRRDPIPYGIGCAYVRDAAVHRAAYGSGVRYFDTSYNYGKGASEEVLGQFIAETDRRTVFIATKAIVVPLRLSGPEAAALVRASLEASLGRLRTDYIDLYQLHETTSLHQAFAEDCILQMLQAARREGLIRYIGIGTASHEVLGGSGGKRGVRQHSDLWRLHAIGAERANAHSRGRSLGRLRRQRQPARRPADLARRPAQPGADGGRSSAAALARRGRLPGLVRARRRRSGRLRLAISARLLGYRAEFIRTGIARPA
ncbi:aldo/keto reductase [Cohnella ginsengisoli]|uniref:Aldo/keto reductase n=1 Tax=Cohnella ginsengisoli TaxID=425004 RepID=A0A9X4QN13_9BACL|nr:aldo/keto reductase [Cohnella ginsengisoli]MDG0792333.1 aldo/keto reductase [Cohnella ginsengisoli]